MTHDATDMWITWDHLKLSICSPLIPFVISSDVST